MKKIGIFTDTHGNLAALKAINNAFLKEECEEIIHTGDVICIGPYSAACLDFMFEKNITMINGNHDINYINGETTPPANSHVPEEHKKYIFEQLGDKYRERLRFLPLVIYRNIYGRKFAFMHYGLSKTMLYRRSVFEPINPEPDVPFFDKLFYGVDADVVFFGHKHEPTEMTGQKMYVDIGSVGCYEEPFARGIVLTVQESGEFEIRRIYEPYDRSSVKEAMLKNAIPYGKELFNFYFRENLNEKN